MRKGEFWTCVKWRNPRRKTRPRLETHRPLIGRVTPQLALAGQSRRSPRASLASHLTEHPSRCAHVSGRGDHATPRQTDGQTAEAGCLRRSSGLCNSCTASQVAPTATSCAAALLLLTCPGRRGGGASTGLAAPEEQSFVSLFFFFLHLHLLRSNLLAERRSNASAFMRNERRVLGSENGTVFARCRLRPPHRVRRREGKAQSQTRPLPLPGLAAS